MRVDDQRSVRALLVFAFVPVLLVVGLLATAVFGNDGSQRTGSGVAPRRVAPAPATPATPPAATTIPARTPAAAPPEAVAPPVAEPPPPVAPLAPPPVAPQPPPPAAPPAPPPVAPQPPPPSPRPGSETSSAYAPTGSERVDVGLGPRGAAIFRKPGTAAQIGPVVIFLHGWVAIDPRRYGSWIGHLARNGSTVIYPTYQSKPAYDTIAPLANALTGVRAALEQVHVAPGRLVVAGHSAGGALAADYAAVAQANGLPVPAAVFSVYPGRKLRHLAVPIPSANLSTIAPSTRVLTYAGERDSAVGTGTAERIVAGAVQTGATLTIVRGDAVDDHSAPRRFDGAAQRTFWEPLDALVAQTEAGVRTASARSGATAAP